ncbi:hypothetical protein G9A89_020558 [Geosiphon pyriformis]|nr:hypothetical protein G9A89_020558 [Geosiphon pyriformis]
MIVCYKSTETEHPQKYIKVVTIGTIRKDHSLYGKALFQYFQKDLRIPAETTYTEIQQPVESDLKEYENKSNNSITAQAKSTVNKKPRVLSPTTPSYHQTPQSRIVFNPPPETQSETLQTSGNSHSWNQHSWTKSLEEYRSLFGNLTPAAGQTEGNPLTWEQPLAQNLAESASLLTEETAILQPIGSSNKGKQPTLAPGEHLNTWTPIPLNITSNTPPINRIMTYRDIAKLEKFSAIERDYYTAAQVLNQFIKGLRSGILRSIKLHHPISLQDAIALVSNFESAEQEVNHTQAVNLAINGTSDINAKITQLKLQELTNHPNGKKITTTVDTYSNRTISNSNNLGDPILTTKKNYEPKSRKLIPATQISAKHGTPIFHTSESTTPIYTTSPIHSTTAPELLSTTTNDTSNSSLSNFPLQPRNSNNNQVQTNSGLSQPIPCGPVQSRPTPTRYLNQASYLSLMEDQGFDKSTSVEREDIERISQPSKQTKSNIPPATITEDTTLATIFLFDIDNLNTHSLFSRAAINQDKPITALYTNVRVKKIDIKLILDSGSADHAATAQIIIADGNTKTPIGEIDNFPFEINGIQIPIKVLVMKATQYQALVKNDWLLKANATLDWNTQELQFIHFKTQCTKEPLIEFEDTSMLPTIKTYQVSWADDYQTELLPPLTWEEKRKSRAKEEPQSSSLGYVILNQRNLFYQPPRLICVDCGKKLSTMGACIGNNEEWPTATKYYCRPYKWDNMLCLTCGKILSDKELWNDVLGKERTSLNRLDGYLHNDHKIWRMASAKAEGAMPKEIREIKDNPWTPKYNGPDYPKDDFFTDNPDAFQN